ncbi:MAG TPA: glycoside hydrolase family 44 protein [Terracidiphilus sp.]|jgi:hypothetical protein
MNRLVKFHLFLSFASICSISTFGAVVTPTMKVTPGASSVTTAQSLQVTVAVTGTTKGTPTGTVVLSSGGYTSAVATLGSSSASISGTASISVPAGALALGSDTLTGKYTPAAGSSYASASATAAVTVTPATANVTVNVDVLSNRHGISPYVYGGAYPNTLADVTNSGMTLVRWGGNATSNYNWKLHTYNAGNDWYFEDFATGGSDADSLKFVTDMKTAGGHALMTMPMLNWVAKAAENGSNGNWSFPVAKFGKQCGTDPYQPDAGNGLEADCSTPITTAAETSPYYPLLDTTATACPSGNCLYRNAWAQALATAFGTGTCVVPETSINSCHFYDMDNEIDIWGGTHRDVHPAPSGYDELANVYETEAANLKTWDPAAVRFGPVSCCWWFYFNGANSNDKGAHAGIDFLPWWLNQVAWLDKIHGRRTLDVFDIHAYPDADTGGLTTAQLQTLSTSIYRDYWDPIYVSTSGTVNQQWTTSMQPKYATPFRIPRMKAMVNAIYPGTPLSFTEWSAAFYKESDFSTALGDADAYGIFGRENLAFASRWTAPVSANPNFYALKLYANYDGAHHTFGNVSVADINNGSRSLFSSYASLNTAGTSMTIMVLNKDPKNGAKVTFNLAGFTPSSYKTYTLVSTAPGKITATSSASWSATQTFAPYSASMLVITGSEVAKPVSEWIVRPDDLMIPASGTATLHPAIRTGTATVTLHSATFDAAEGVAACSGSMIMTDSTVTPTVPGTITVHAGATPGFCHYTVIGGDGTAAQRQGGWIVVGLPAATLTSTGNNQSGTAGTVLAAPLKVTLSPGQSGGTAIGAGILFTTSAGILTSGTTTGTSVIATTNASGVATVTLKLPATKGTVTVTAQDQFALGGAAVTFTETSK